MESISFWIKMSSEATNAQRNVVPDINVRNAILSTDVAKIKKDAETAIEKDVENSVKVQYSLQGNSMTAEEEQRIVDEAKANGTYLKAPNGKASNLNERQWIQVRTKAFKDWFGDWELAYTCRETIKDCIRILLPMFLYIEMIP